MFRNIFPVQMIYGGKETELIADFVDILENAGNLSGWTKEQKINIVRKKYYSK